MSGYEMRLAQLFPFLRWFPLTKDTLKSDGIAGITVAMILVPQSMAYANLAGLPVVYGLYASFLPVMIASMWGASKFLHTGPVAMLSLMSAAAIEPLATRGSDEFMQIAFLLAFMVGVLRLLLGVFKMGVLMNLTSSPVIIGFTNAAALIIGMSLLSSFIGVPMPRSDSFLYDLSQVFFLIPHAHLPTLLFAVGTVVFLKVLSKYFKRLPGVLIAVVMGIVISYAIDFEDKVEVLPQQIIDGSISETFQKLASAKDKLKSIKDEEGVIRSELQEVLPFNKKIELESNLLSLESQETVIKNDIYNYTIEAHKYSLTSEKSNGTVLYAKFDGYALFHKVYRLHGFNGDKYVLSAGGSVVGEIPSGLPSFSIPKFDFDLISTLFFTSFVIALIGFMEATSISRALAAKSREKLNPNQELIGQGLANIVGSFFQSYVVSGSFSRSAVAAKVGAKTGMFAIFSALGVVFVMLFLTEYLYHLPKAILAAIVMTAVFSLIDVKSIIHAWKVSRSDGVAGVTTFLATLYMAPSLADGVLIGIGLTVILYLMGNMKPRSEIMGLDKDGALKGAASHDLPPISENFVVIRFDGSLVFVNVAHFEYAVMDALSYFPNAKGVLIACHGINELDASGETKIRTLVSDLKSADITFAVAGMKRQLIDAMEESGLDKVIGSKNMFSSISTGIQDFRNRFEK